MLATTEAQRAGYDEGILLTDEGFVADGPGENIFVVKDGRILTPPLSTSILPGITRDSVIQIAQDLGYVVEETDVIRADLALADEVFMTGTAAEVTPVRAVDDVELGVGPVTLEIQRAYLDMVNGRSERVEPLARRRRGRRSRSRLGRDAARRRAASTVATTRSCSRPSGASRSAGRARARTAAPRRRRRTPRATAKTGCRCIGFQSGRASMSSASSASADRLAVGAEGVGVDDDAREPGVRRRRSAASGMKEIPGASASSSR